MGFGGSPDENGETTLDALIIDGVSLQVGSVGALRNVKNAIGVARAVMEYTSHTMLVGDQATAFAVEMGFETTNLTTAGSQQIWEDWQTADCQPNMRRNVQPDPTKFCGPYKPAGAQMLAEREIEALSTNGGHAPASSSPRDRSRAAISESNHDTISMIVIDASGNMAAGVTPHRTHALRLCEGSQCPLRQAEWSRERDLPPNLFSHLDLSAGLLWLLCCVRAVLSVAWLSVFSRQARTA